MFFFSDAYALPPGMDPSFLFRSPLLSDAENNNLMAAAAAAEKARAMMMMGARPPGPPGGPLGPPPPPPLGLFPNAALAALAASTNNANLIPSRGPPITTSAPSSLPQLYSTLGSNRENPLGLSPALFSHWNALHQAAALASATSNNNGLQMTSASSCSSPESPKPSSSPVTTSVLPTAAMSPLLTSATSGGLMAAGVVASAGQPPQPPSSDLRLARPLFWDKLPVPPPAMRFAPYIVPPKRSTSPASSNISNPEESISRSSPLILSENRMRPDSTSPDGARSSS